jgi:hypothetical protein
LKKGKYQMIINIYAIYDLKAEAYGRPFFLEADGLAIRSFAEATLNPQTEISKYPEDFRLFKMGTYDDSNGNIKSMIPKVLVTAVEAKKSLEKVQSKEGKLDE